MRIEKTMLLSQLLCESSRLVGGFFYVWDWDLEEIRMGLGCARWVH